MQKLELIRKQMFQGKDFNIMVHHPYPQKHYVSILKHMGFRKIVKAPPNTIHLIDKPSLYLVTRKELVEMINYDKITIENQFDSEYDLDL